MKILIIPDAIWGNDSGNRSFNCLVNDLTRMGHDLAVLGSEIQPSNYLPQFKYYPKDKYRFYDHLYKNFTYLNKILGEFSPDIVLLFGSIANKVEIKFFKNKNIPTIFHPLTTEFYCAKNFAGRNGSSCYECLNGNYFNSLRYDCLNDRSFLRALKIIFEKFFGSKLALKADFVLSHGKTYTKILEDFGIDPKKIIETGIFFDGSDFKDMHTTRGDYFLLLGQNTEAKGFLHYPKILSNHSLNFKVLIYDPQIAKKLIKNNNLSEAIECGRIEIISDLKDHSEVLKLTAGSLGVIITSSYPTSGEFSLLESLCLGKPVLLFEEGIHKDFIINNQNGFIFKSNDLDSLLSVAEEIADDKLNLTDITLNALKLFNDLTSFQKKTESYKKIQKSIIKIVN